MIRYVLSDLGKVLIFFDNDIFFRKIAKNSPFMQEEIRELTFSHFYLVESFDRGEISPEEFYRQVTKKLKAQIDYDRFYSIYNDVFSLNSPVFQLMIRLKKNYKIVLLSNTDVMRFNFIKNKFPEIMIFDEYVLSYQVGFIKPHPQIYKEALKKAGAEAKECVFIDDREENIEEAERLGISGILMEPHTDLETVLQEKGLSF
jgi:HAD superfamily hydrolase (TIGR01509 family)